MRRAPAKAAQAETQYQMDGETYTESQLIDYFKGKYGLTDDYTSVDDAVLAAYKSVKVDVDQLNKDFVDKVLKDKTTTTGDEDLDDIIDKAKTVIDTYNNGNSFSANFSSIKDTASKSVTNQDSVIKTSTETTDSETNEVEDGLKKTTETVETKTAENVENKEVPTGKTEKTYTYTTGTWWNKATHTVAESKVEKRGNRIRVYGDWEWHQIDSTSTKPVTVTKYDYDIKTTVTEKESYSATYLYSEEEYNTATKILGWSKLLKAASEGKVNALVYTLKDDKGTPAYINDYVDQNDSEVVGHASSGYDDAYWNNRNRNSVCSKTADFLNLTICHPYAASSNSIK